MAVFKKLFFIFFYLYFQSFYYYIPAKLITSTMPTMSNKLKFVSQIVYFGYDWYAKHKWGLPKWIKCIYDYKSKIILNFNNH